MRSSTVLHAVELTALAVLWLCVDTLMDLAAPGVIGRQTDWPSRDLGEMRHAEDRASVSEWGHAG